MKALNRSSKLPYEAEEQSALFRMLEPLSVRHPELLLLYAIPNGGSRNKIEAAHLKAQGVKRGVPDLCLPVARGGYHGLYIEMKRQQGGRVSDEQKWWLGQLRRQGYLTAVAKGAQPALELIMKYIKGGIKRNET